MILSFAGACLHKCGLLLEPPPNVDSKRLHGVCSVLFCCCVGSLVPTFLVSTLLFLFGGSVGLGSLLAWVRNLRERKRSSMLGVPDLGSGTTISAPAGGSLVSTSGVGLASHSVHPVGHFLSEIQVVLIVFLSIFCCG